MPRESTACIANIHAWPLSRCAIEIWWDALADTRATADLSGELKLALNRFQVIQSNANICFLFIFADWQRNAYNQSKGWCRIQFTTWATARRALTIFLYIQLRKKWICVNTFLWKEKKTVIKLDCWTILLRFSIHRVFYILLFMEPTSQS